MSKHISVQICNHGNTHNGIQVSGYVGKRVSTEMRMVAYGQTTASISTQVCNGIRKGEKGSELQFTKH